MQAIVLAAGPGARLGRGPKALVPLLGLTLAERCVLALSRAGVDEFVLVVGAGDEAAHRGLADRLARRGLQVTLVRNEAWFRGNALSVLAARPVAQGRFLVAMADHVFDPDVARRLLSVEADFAVVVDRDPRFVDAAEATRVRVEGERVVEARKGLIPFDGVDAGLFLCSSAIFSAIEAAEREGVEAWSEVVARMKPVAVWFSGAFWLDVDTPADFVRAEQLLLSRLGKAEDGPVSRHLNRPLSRRISRRLVATRLSPVVMSALAFLLAAVAGLLFAFSVAWWLIALSGTLVQIASVLDGVDGEIARLRFEESPRGAWLDAILDRYADGIVLGGMAWGSATGNALAWPVGIAALLGALAVSYSAARYEATFRAPGPWSRRAIPAKRDARSFIIFLGGLLNAVLPALVVVAVASHAEVVRRLLLAGRRA